VIKPVTININPIPFNKRTQLPETGAGSSEPSLFLLELPEKAGIDHSKSKSQAAGKKFLSAAAVSPDPLCPVKQQASQNIIVKERCRVLLPCAGVKPK
jgi:hypothetical protein